MYKLRHAGRKSGIQELQRVCFDKVSGACSLTDGRYIIMRLVEEKTVSTWRNACLTPEK